MPLQMTVDTRAALRWTRALRRLPADMRREIAKVLRAEGRRVAREARAIIRDPSQTPVSRSGRLARSIRVRSVARSGGLAVRVETTEPHGRFLETGTTRGGRRETVSSLRRRRGSLQLVRVRRSLRRGGTARAGAHPFLTLAAIKRQPEGERAIGDAIERALAAFARAHP